MMNKLDERKKKLCSCKTQPQKHVITYPAPLRKTPGATSEKVGPTQFCIQNLAENHGL